MSRATMTLGQDESAQVQRWMPPDVGLGGRRKLGRQLPDSNEVAAIKEAARKAGAEAGHREGYAAGYEEGRQHAAREAETERAARLKREQAEQQARDAALRDSLSALESIAADLADPLAKSADALEPELLLLVVTLAKRVLMSELQTRPELVQEVLHQALSALPSRNHPVRLHINPRDQAVLDTYAEARAEQITWIADPAIEPGGCLLESGPSRIDACLGTRLQQAVDAIWGELERPAGLALEVMPQIEEVPALGVAPTVSADLTGDASDEPAVPPSSAAASPVLAAPHSSGDPAASAGPAAPERLATTAGLPVLAEADRADVAESAP